MQHFITFFLLVYAVVSQPYAVPTANYPLYGEPYMGEYHPLWYERSALVWTSLVRIDPAYFRETYIVPATSDGSAKSILKSSFYVGPKTPFIWDLNLNRAAYAHGIDRMTCYNQGVYAHNDCNGSAAGTRITRFSPNWYAEVMFEWQTNYNWMILPFNSINAWICDGSNYASGDMVGCAPDGSENDGHRRNLHSSALTIGYGFYIKNQYFCATGNLGTSSPYSNIYITDGAHIVEKSTPNSYQFAATVMGNPSRVVVVVDGASEQLSRITGSAQAGWYATSKRAFGSTCQKYHFEATISGLTYRYPTKGEFLTFRVGYCEQDYVQAVACTEGQYAVGDECRPCSSVLSYCSACSSASTCTKCQNGAYIVDGKCQLCSGLDICQSCDRVSCTGCRLGYFLSSSKCQPCSVLSNGCTACTSTSCTSCSSGYFLNYGYCAPCSTISTGCSTCTSSGCTSCNANYFLNGGVCRSCISPSTCTSCDGFKCLGCRNGYYLNETCMACSGHDPNCVRCDIDKCHECSARFAPQGRLCLACPAHCNLCEEPHCATCAPFCTACNDPFEIVSGECLLFSTGSRLVIDRSKLTGEVDGVVKCVLDDLAQMTEITFTVVNRTYDDASIVVELGTSSPDQLHVLEKALEDIPEKSLCASAIVTPPEEGSFAAVMSVTWSLLLAFGAPLLWWILES